MYNLTQSNILYTFVFRNHSTLGQNAPSNKIKFIFAQYLDKARPYQNVH